MNAYLPHDPAVVWLVGALLVGTLGVGFGLTRLHSASLARGTAWVLVVLAVGGMERLCRAEPPGFRMLALIGVLLYAMKAVVAVEAQADGAQRLTLPQWLCFAALWFGMRPAIFRTLGAPSLPGTAELFRFALRCLLLGAALVGLARLTWMFTSPWLDRRLALFLVTALLLPGLSLMLHFGVLNLAAAGWRLAGVDCRPLFREPLRSQSLGEFWGRRWNLAFTEMTAIGVYRPLEVRLGKRSATLAAFLCSGLVHELATSVPVGWGYGLPFLYFLLHGGLVLFERRSGAGGPGRRWTLIWLLLPLPLLFPPPFLQGVVWPLIGIRGGM
jgi:alginate O-acetyltransferase complex protein AlgI